MTTSSSSVSVGPMPAPARRSGWPTVLSVVVLIAAMGAAFMVGRITKADAESPADLADTTVTAFLDDYVAAVNTGDQAGIAEFYATDAMVTSAIPSDPWVMKGKDQIARAIRSWWDVLGFRMEHVGTAVQKGELVMQSYDAPWGPTMSVFQLRDGKILNQWLLGAAT